MQETQAPRNKTKGGASCAAFPNLRTSAEDMLGLRRLRLLLLVPTGFMRSIAARRDRLNVGRDVVVVVPCSSVRKRWHILTVKFYFESELSSISG